MGLWKITEKGPTKVSETAIKSEKLLEEHLENWICSEASMLGEPLLIVGRQVLIPDTKDRLDLLALDPQGNAVILELKRGKLKDPVDVQAMRYASYISKWGFEEFENIARNYMGKVEDPEFNFNSIYESFCEEAGVDVDDVPDINKEQRIIIVGSAVREKIGSVALWLFEHGIDMKVIEIHAYKEGESIFIEPNVVVPMPVSKFEKVGSGKVSEGAWSADGKSWHLEKRCSLKTRSIFLKLDEIIQQNLEVDGPKWNQKHYVAYRIKNYNWLSVITTPNYLRFDFLVKSNCFTTEGVATLLNIAKFDKEESLSEKFGLPSSVFIKNRSDKIDKIHIRVKDDFNINSDKFLSFLKEAYKAFPK